MRLTKTIRDSMITKLTKEKFDKPIAKADKDILDKVIYPALKTLYPPKIQEWIDNSPPGGLHSVNYISAYLETEKGVEDKYLGRFNVVGIKVLLNDLYNSKLYLTPARYKKLEELNGTLNSIIKQKLNFINTVTEVLYSCNTAKQLYTNYPELCKYLPEIETSKALMITEKKLIDTLHAKVPDKK